MEQIEQILQIIIDAFNTWSQTVLPKDTAICIVEASRDLFVRFYGLAMEYITVLGG